MEEPTITALFRFILLLLNLIALAVLIASYLEEDWLYQDSTNSYQWSGSLFEMKSGFSSDDLYKDIASEYCGKEASS